ncbi:MAG: hypothetical protein V4603_17675 [Pseudomonadota bacterium]
MTSETKNSDMTFNDEILSAFMDGELAPADMESVRAALKHDDELVARLAVLSQVDTLVKKQSQHADDRPMPAAVLAMLTAEAPAAPKQSAVILQGPWQRWRQPLALAASVAVVASLSLVYLNRGSAELPPLTSYAASLDTATSGTVVTVDDATLVTRFSFRNRQEQYCRQYQLASDTQRTENVACRLAGDWNLVATVELPIQRTDEFQPATNTSSLDLMLDGLMQGQALDLATEAALISEGWQDAR